MLRRLALAALLALAPSLASAQFATIGPTPPNGDNSNRLATTAFVQAGGGGGAVSSVFTRTGAVTAASGDYSFSLISGSLACSQMPALTGDASSTAGTCATAIGATKVTSAMLNADVFSTAHSWAGQQTFVAPILGTPASGTATNLTGLPISTGLTGAGTGVLTALGVNIGSAGAFTTFNGAHGTPSSITLTSATGLPLTTGVTGILPLANGGTNNAMTASSGGVVWSDASKLNVTSALGASQILLGGGAGAGPSASGCTIDTNNSPSCASGTSFRPAAFFTNSTADSGKASFAFLKSRAGGAVINGDNLGGLGFQAFANGGFQAASDIIASAVGAPVGSNVPSDIKFFTSNTAGQENQIFRIDNNAHFGVSAQATAPTITAGCNGAGSSVGTNSADNHGWITGQTAAATTCTITFGTGFGARPACVVSGEQSAILTMTPGASTLVVTFASTASYKFDWVCHGF